MTTRRAPNLPFLPGTSIYEPPTLRSNFRKPQALTFRNGVPVFDVEQPGIGGAKLPIHELIPDWGAKAITSRDVLTQRGRKFSGPNWVAFSSQVLRFEGWFREPVPESPLEEMRVRKVVLCFFLEDDTIQIIEPKMKNSGMPQGILIKRQKVPKEGIQHYTIADIDVGKEIVIYGKTIKLVNCDDLTRHFMEEQCGIKVGAPQEYPNDQYTAKRREVETTMRPRPSREARDQLRKFLQYDGKVLRFYCYWDDRGNEFGDLRRFVLHYFLADDTIEVLEELEPNSGRDAFPVFIKRQSPPRQFGDVKNLRIGSEINIFHRTFCVYDTDEFTRKFFVEQFGVKDLGQPIELDELTPKPPTPVKEIPPYTGFGSEEDSLASCVSLVARPPKKDFAKFMKHDKRVLRFSATLDSPKPEDKDRKFIICFFMADDTVAIFEPPQRNSGITGGKFLERRKVKKPAPKIATMDSRSPPRSPNASHSLQSRSIPGTAPLQHTATAGPDAYYTAADFYVGGTVEVFGHRFVLHDADEHALKFMEANASEFPKADLFEIEQRLGQALRDSGVDLKQAFRNLDINNDGYLSREEFKNGFKRLLGAAATAELTEHEILTIIRRYDLDGDGRVDYNEFVTALSNEM